MYNIKKAFNACIRFCAVSCGLLLIIHRRVMDLDNPVPTVYAEVDFSTREASGKYVCSVCGFVYDPAEHDGVAFEELPADWKCPRCKQPKEKFNKA